MTNQVLLVPYNPDWPLRFEEERHLLTAVFADTGAAIEHIGSTAVPGLGAKPVIDVLVGVPDLGVAEARIGALERIGYEYARAYEARIPGRRYFRKPRIGIRAVHVHCVVTGGDLWVRHLVFRDYLRGHWQIAVAYHDLKTRLAARLSRAEYTQAKRPFIEQVLASAMAPGGDGFAGTHDAPPNTRRASPSLTTATASCPGVPCAAENHCPDTGATCNTCNRFTVASATPTSPPSRRLAQHGGLPGSPR